jgi:hypothetical protein
MKLHEFQEKMTRKLEGIHVVVCLEYPELVMR